MGPIALFDKSFLQSLNLDQSVWFDHFFLSNVSPLFFAETLADLEKPPREGRTAEDEVRVIADKTPQMHGAPCVHHMTLAFNNLLGRAVAMDTGQIPLAGGRRVRVGAEIGTVFEQAPEARAFSRWQHGAFEEVERSFAREWREQLATVDLSAAKSLLEGIGLGTVHCKSLEEARATAASIVSGTDRLADRMRLVLSLLGMRPGLFAPIQLAWDQAGRLPVNVYAPYAAYIAEVEIFFNICLSSGLISPERASNKIDIAYLFYLPFCMVFVSTDNLHRRCAPLFLRADQNFVWGSDLKAELQRADDFYRELPDETKELGIMAFAHTPPDLTDSLLVQLWDRHLPRWREVMRPDKIQPSKDNPELAHKLRRFERAPSLPPTDPAYDSPQSDALSIQRLITKKRGTWWQLPKNLKPQEVA